MKKIIFLISAACLSNNWAQAEQFQIEGALIESQSGKGLGITREKGDISRFFQAQKTMMLGILNSAGIDFNQLPDNVRANLQRYHTTNLEAFKAFSKGLDLEDEGKYAEARNFFSKAAELDSSFKLAQEKRDAMPNISLNNNLQLRSIIRNTADNAVTEGKTVAAIDASQAVAAMQAGQTVVVGKSLDTPSSKPKTDANVGDFKSNLPGSGADQYEVRKVVGIAFSYTSNTNNTITLATTNEWGESQHSAPNNVLDQVGGNTGFTAKRANATATALGQHTLGDGSMVYWGNWASTPNASAIVSVSGTQLSAPTLGSQTHYMLGNATSVMPTSGQVSFSPTSAGFLGNVTGTISVDFKTREVGLNNLGFDLSGLRFDNLNGKSTYDSGVASGFFKGNYTSGTCTGCSTFSPAASAFTGNFVGSGANGVMISNTMQNGNGTVAGVHLFTK